MKPGSRITLTLLAAASFVFAQDTSSSGWKPVGSSGQAPALQQNGPPAAPPPQAAPALPPQLNLKAGTYVMVRVNQTLSSDKNQGGDTFTATLVQPLVVDGFVAARPAQTFGGKVAGAMKANKASHGVSHLGLQLTDLMFADGQHATIQSELVAINEPNRSSNTTVASGATGTGSIPGELLTRGRSTVVKPEAILTFKIDSDVSIATDRAPQAFRPVSASDYGRPPLQARRPAPGYYAGYPYPYYPYPYAYPYPYWGPGVGVYFGGVWGPGFGFRGRWR